MGEGGEEAAHLSVSTSHILPEDFNLSIIWSFSSKVDLKLMKCFLFITAPKQTQLTGSQKQMFFSSSGSGYSDKTFTQHLKKNCTRGGFGLCINWRSRFLSDLREKRCSMSFLPTQSFPKAMMVSKMVCPSFVRGALADLDVRREGLGECSGSFGTVTLSQQNCEGL